MFVCVVRNTSLKVSESDLKLQSAAFYGRGRVTRIFTRQFPGLLDVIIIIPVPPYFT